MLPKGLHLHFSKQVKWRKLDERSSKQSLSFLFSTEMATEYSLELFVSMNNKKKMFRSL